MPGERCTKLIDQEIQGIYTNSVHVDELWTFVHKKQRRLEPNDRSEWGDACFFMAIERESKLILAAEVGKRDEETTDRFIGTLSRRVGGEVQLFTDGWGSYRRWQPD